MQMDTGVRFRRIRWILIFVVSSIGFLRCGNNDASRHTENRVLHEVHLDLTENDLNVAKSWDQMVARIGPETQIWAAFSKWNDTLTLYPLVRHLRKLKPSPVFKLVQDSVSFAAVPQSLRDSFTAWQAEGILSEPPKRSTKAVRIKEFEIVFRNLLPSVQGSGKSSVVFLHQGPPHIRLMLGVHGDEGLADVFVERIETMVAGSNRTNEVSTRITTDQFTHLTHYYPVTFRHFLLDSLLDELEYGLQVLRRPSRIRISTSQDIDPLIANELDYLVKVYDLDMAVVYREDAKQLESLRDWESMVRKVPQDVWLPEMVLLEGDFGKPAEGRPRKRQIFMLGSISCLLPVEQGRPGLILQVLQPTIFQDGLKAWQRMWDVAQPIGHPVEFEDSNGQEDS